MADEVDYEREHPCPCGASTYTVVGESNDWGGNRELWRMDCIDCLSTYDLDTFTRREGDRQYVGYRWVPAEASSASVKRESA